MNVHDKKEPWAIAQCNTRRSQTTRHEALTTDSVKAASHVHMAQGPLPNVTRDVGVYQG